MIFVTIAEYCAQTGANRRTMSRLCANGTIKAQRDGKKWLIGLDVVEAEGDFHFIDDEDCDCCDDAPPTAAPEPVSCATTDDVYEIECCGEFDSDGETMTVKAVGKIPLSLKIKILGVDLG
jgi:excisionase family DNA binding protein